MLQHRHWRVEIVADVRRSGGEERYRVEEKEELKAAAATFGITGGGNGSDGGERMIRACGGGEAAALSLEQRSEREGIEGEEKRFCLILSINFHFVR